jgi:cell shape-determining protein MreC
VYSGLSSVSNVIFHPFITLGNSISLKFENLSSYFVSKDSLSKEIGDLKLDLAFNEAKIANYETIFGENEKLKEILSRKNEKLNLILAVILSDTNQSLYDTLVVDAGSIQGVTTGATVFALGNVPIGRVDLVYENSSRIILFSNPGEKTSVDINDTTFELVGRGGGNFEMNLPRDIDLQKGAQAVLPRVTPHVVATVETIISDPRDAFKKALLVSPVNIKELRFVEIEK